MSTQPPPPPPMQQAPMPQYQPEPPRPGPGRKWYFIALVVLALFVVPSLLGFLKGLDGITDGLVRVRVPGESVVTLEEGDWTVFYEHAGVFEGESYTNSTEFPGMEATVIAEDGTSIPVTPSVGNFEYNWGGRAGFSVGEVDIPEDGEYTFSAAHYDPANTQEYVLALGKDLGRSTVLIAVGVIGMAAGVFIAFIIWLVTIILRSKAKRRRQAAAYPG